MESEELAERLAGIQRRVAAAAARGGRNAADVVIIGVTKTHPADVVRKAVLAGIADIGESKVQEAAGKMDAVADLRERFTLHLIGHLQSNKAKQAVQYFDVVHSVDSLKLARELQRHCITPGKQLRVLLQVNISGEDTKSGYEPTTLSQELPELLDTCPGLLVEGFMTMAPYSDNPEDARPHFRSLRLLAEELRSRVTTFPNWKGTQLSMGMTGDFEPAIEEGATLVRIGTALFGNR
jgi:PLP dependent protein